jgi:DNA primase
MRYSQELIQKVREAHDIIDVFQNAFRNTKNTDVQMSGVNGKALCPFHDENTPSFNLNTVTGTYHCFGCGESGDVISLIMETNGGNFTDAIEYLAETAQPPIELPKRNSDEGNVTSNRRLKEITAAAWDFYVKQYANLPESHPAKTQVTGRALNPNQPHYGYAPGGNALTKHLAQTYTPHELTLAGVCAQNKDTGELYDFWRDRLMFAITDMHGTPVSFTGRALNPDEERKYVNGRATPIFEKEKLLYSPNITHANQTARETKTCYIVEGQFDVISMYDNGYTNVYATSGTAITNQHIKTLQRLTGETGNIIYILDGDKAGMKATAAAYHTAPHAQAQSWAVTMPPNIDPCDYLQQYGQTNFTKHLNTAIQPLTSAALNYYADIYSPTALNTQTAFLTEAAKMLTNTPTPAIKQLIINTTAQYTGTNTYQAEKTLRQHATQTRKPPQEKTHEGTNNTTITHQWATPNDESAYHSTVTLLNAGDKQTLAARKLLHLALYYGASQRLIQPEAWQELPVIIHQLYNEAVTLYQEGKTLHPDNFANPPLATLLVAPTQADSTHLTPEQVTREFDTTLKMLTRANIRKRKTAHH